MQIAYITEDFNQGDYFFIEQDRRARLYDDNCFTPTSSLAAIIWQDFDSEYPQASDLIKTGSFNATHAIAEVIMSFDPYGVECYPCQLHFNSPEYLSDRYILAVDNIVDVLDDNKSQPEQHEYYLCEEKIKKLPECKRHVFKPRGMNKVFFSPELFQALADIAEAGKIHTSIIAYLFDTEQRAPDL